MNKFYGVKESAVRDDLNFIKQLNFSSKKLDDSLWTKCMHPKAHHLDHKKEEENEEPKPPRFRSHPKRMFSDTDTSVVDSSPRRVNMSSSGSNVHLERNEFVYEVYEENKVEIVNTRKKLHKKLTQTKDDDTYHFEVGIGDSSSVSPRTPIRGRRSVNFEDEKCVQVEVEPPKPTKPKQKVNKNVVTMPSKKVGSKNSSLHSSRRSVISDSVFEKKFKTFVEKSLHTISDIRALLETGISPPDGDEDMSRRMVRVKEFSNRFSRNCLYPLARQLEGMSTISADDANTNRKLLSSYQIVLNGLQAYLNHLPTSMGSCSSDKLKMLLQHLLELCDVHRKVVKQPDDDCFADFIDTFKLNAELTLQKIDEVFNAISTDSVLKSNTTKISLQEYGTSKVNLKDKPKKNKIEKRLSMYTISASFRRDPNWKRAVESLAKKKLNVKSRYKTATFSHRPPVEKESPPIISFPSKCKLFCKKSSDMLKRTPITTPVNEDTITTMVQMEDEKGREVKEGSGVKEDAERPLNHEEVVVKLLQLVLDNNQRKSAADEGKAEAAAAAAASTAAEEQIADILERLRSEGNAETLQKIVDGLQHKKKKELVEREETLQLKIVTSQCSLEDGSGKKRKEPIVTVTGEKNAKLICIKDENSIVETEDDGERDDKVTCQAKEELIKADAKVKEKAKNSHKPSKQATSIKLNRLPKSSRVLRVLPKNYAVSIIQYKLDFHKSCKTNPMYRRTTSVEPWMLMGKISDEILNHALLRVASEIEVNDVVQKIFESELQL